MSCNLTVELKGGEEQRARRTCMQLKIFNPVAFFLSFFLCPNALSSIPPTHRFLIHVNTRTKVLSQVTGCFHRCRLLPAMSSNDRPQPRLIRFVDTARTIDLKDVQDDGPQCQRPTGHIFTQSRPSPSMPPGFLHRLRWPGSLGGSTSHLLLIKLSMPRIADLCRTRTAPDMDTIHPMNRP